MSIIRWRPGFAEDPFEEMDKFLREGLPAVASEKTIGFVPTVDIYETKEGLVVESPLAGIDPKDVKISIENNVLTIKGESKKETEVDEKSYYRKEVRSGSFYRRVALPSPVIGEKAKAISENGILKITIPKLPEVKKEKSIKIKIASPKK